MTELLRKFHIQGDFYAADLPALKHSSENDDEEGKLYREAALQTSLPC